MRVSNNEHFGTMMSQMARLQANMQNQLMQISTGKKYQKISDEPLVANQSFLINHSQNRLGQFQKNIEDGLNFLKTTELNLGTVVDAMQGTREKALEAANGTMSKEDKNTLAKTMDQTIQEFVSIANTKYLGKYIYAGEKTDTVPFTYDGNTVSYHGDNSEISFDISETSSMKVSESGDRAFQQVFDSLVGLRDAIKNGTPADIQNKIGDFDKALESTIDLRSDVGTRMESLESVNEIYTTNKSDLEIKKAKIEGVDLPTAISEFAQTMQVYQGALMANSKALKLSIMDFI